MVSKIKRGHAKKIIGLLLAFSIIAVSISCLTNSNHKRANAASAVAFTYAVYTNSENGREEISVTGLTSTHRYDSTIVIPSEIDGKAVTKIGGFSGYSSLINITLPDSLLIIESSAFSDCVNITGIIAQLGITYIGDYAFDNCINLKSITLPDTANTIGEYAFRNCTKLESITLPQSLTKIPVNLFQNCNSLKSIVIPDKVENIESGAFYNCSALASISIGKSLKIITAELLNSCSALYAITVNSDNPYFTAENNVIFNKDKTRLICYPQGKTGEYIIPNSVSIITDYAFYNNNNITNIIITENITFVGDNAFRYCTNLLTVTFMRSAAQGITVIGHQVFPTSHKFKIMVNGKNDYQGGTWSIYKDYLYEVEPDSGVKKDISGRLNISINSYNLPAHEFCTFNSETLEYDNSVNNHAKHKLYVKHSGSSICPLLKISYPYTMGQVAFELNKDFTISYSNNIDIGTATITVSGIGSYKGSQNITFYIVEELPKYIVENELKRQGIKSQRLYSLAPAIITPILFVLLILTMNRRIKKLIEKKAPDRRNSFQSSLGFQSTQKIHKNARIFFAILCGILELSQLFTLFGALTPNIFLVAITYVLDASLLLVLLAQLLQKPLL